MSDADMLHGREDYPTLASVEVGHDPFSVVVTWEDGPRAGRRDLIDLAPVILTYRVFVPLRDDRALFATVRVAEFGEALEWGEGDEISVASKTLARLAEEAMTNADFAAFLKRHALTRDAAAGQLGIARRLVSYYAKDRKIPRSIALACKYLDGLRI
ncbi:DUF2442 domain-containing protein [Methylobacterium sp. A54F]